MKISGIYINGFGIFRDIRLENLSPGINLFLGSNESGKSTLLGFIRSILFGFPDGRSSENPYPPLKGGRHGGNIELTLNSKRYVVERYPGTRGGSLEISMPDHSKAGREALSRLIQITDRSLFNNIYAFSLSELQTLESLSSDSVEEALYSAGAGINLNALARLKAETEKRENDLFKSRGKGARINMILTRLTDILSQEKNLRRLAGEYDHITAQAAGLAEEIESLKKRKKELLILLRKMEQQSSILPLWTDLVIAQQKLALLENVRSFPSQGIARFEGLQGRLKDLEREKQEKAGEIKQWQETLQKLKIDETLLKHASQIRQMEKDSVYLASVEQQLSREGLELRAKETRLGEGMNRLGSSWSEEKLKGFDLSIAVHEQVTRHRRILADEHFAEQQRKEQLRRVRSDLNDAAKNLKEMKEPEIKDAGQLQDLRQSCFRIRELETEKRLLKKEIQYKIDRLDDLKEEKEALEALYSAGSLDPSFKTIFFILPAALLAAALSGLAGRWLWSAAGVILLFTVAALTWILKSKTEKEAQKRKEAQDTRLKQIESKTGILERDIFSLNDRITQADEKTVQENILFSKAPFPHDLPCDEREHIISGQLDLLKTWTDALKIMEQAGKKAEEEDYEYKRAENTYRNVLQEWSLWLKDHNLDSALSPEGMIEMISIIKTLREQLENIEQQRARLLSLEQQRCEYIETFTGILNACAPKENRGMDLRLSIGEMVHDLDLTEQAVQKRSLLIEQIKAAEESAGRLKTQAFKLKGEIGELMRSGGAEEEEEFRKRGEIFEKRIILEQKIESCEEGIKRQVREHGDIERITQEISNLDSCELEQNRALFEEELEGVEKELTRLTREHAGLEERARRMVNDTGISELRIEEESLKQELTSLSEEWLTMRLAGFLISGTRAGYEKERQPEILSEGSSFFSKMTLERYRSIVSPIGEKRIEVVDADNSRLTIDKLSRGTAEQLYLSLRFGFIKEFSRNFAPLPVVMDDILVNFDPERAGETIKGIVELSAQHQILFFTCHPYIKEMFTRERPDIRVYTIADEEIK